MDKKLKKNMRGVFFCQKADGTITDARIVDEMLQDEDKIRKELIAKGVIKQFVLVSKKQE